MTQGLLMRLREDHAHFKSLLDQLKDTSSDDTDERKEKFDQLNSDIRAHMEAEEEMFYPRIKEKRPSAKEDANEGTEEHHMARKALDELDAMDKGADRWGPLLGVAKEMIEHHIAEEQAILFKHADRGFTDSELEEMRKQFDEIRGTA
ncbi:MAG: hemerythrin domain-containing protein [Armatimonadota bacterium]